MARYRHLKQRLHKTHYCGFHFRQRCLRFREHCEHAHGFEDLVRLPPAEVLALRQELFNLKQRLGIMQNTVLFNEKSKRYEIYKTEAFNRLRQLKGQAVEDEEANQEEEEDEEDKAEELRAMKKSLANLNLDECQVLDRIDDASDLYKFDMNKALDSEDEYNVAKRRPRTKPELAIVRPWQNKVMARFLSMLLEEAGDMWLTRDWVLNRYKESGVPITWPRIATFNIYFEKKAVVPPFSEKEKKVLILPLKSPDANITDLEDAIVEILLDKVQQ